MHAFIWNPVFLKSKHSVSVKFSAGNFDSKETTSASLELYTIAAKQELARILTCRVPKIHNEDPTRH
ncbi:hypothetical protein AMELA_G00256900 [Ameiurus melas]|uniref:Uncharacterized protein n=1 Tax=Ameiurus melas TaxID=219545 RepID=A0A7J5ZUD5_AMEME|nr:hypothetical protein AMELA_G00256900 [Ameiurus melas]